MSEPTGYATREQVQAAIERRRREARRRGSRPLWFLAGGSVGALGLVVVILQLVPASESRDPVAGGFRLPRVEFVRHDSTTTEPVTLPAELHSASTPAPVETVVPPTPHEASPADSSAREAGEAPKDSTNGAPGR